MSTVAVVGKLLSESLLSLYPVFVKNIGLPLNLQLWSRTLIYVLIALIFCNLGFVYNYLFIPIGIILGFTNLVHIYTSYRGFQLLESGVAYTLFYTYPMMILLLSGKGFNKYILIGFLGAYLLSYDTLFKHENFKNEEDKNIDPENFKYEGLIMILLAAFTEALIYFQVRKIKTENNWNHVFLSYFMGMVILTLYIFLFKKEVLVKENLTKFSLALVINAVIGSLGYYLRFYAATRIEPSFYAILSYFGIVMSFVYGVLINKEEITITKVIGSLLIIISSKFIHYN